jgi:hypothetical protein
MGTLIKADVVFNLEVLFRTFKFYYPQHYIGRYLNEWPIKVNPGANPTTFEFTAIYNASVVVG